MAGSLLRKTAQRILGARLAKHQSPQTLPPVRAPRSPEPLSFLKLMLTPRSFRGDRCCDTPPPPHHRDTPEPSPQRAPGAPGGFGAAGGFGSRPPCKAQRGERLLPLYSESEEELLVFFSIFSLKSSPGLVGILPAGSCPP